MAGMSTWREKMDVEMEANRAETKAMRYKRMEANMNDDQKETMACQDAMEAKPEKMEANL
jgi:SHS2 domain-containing protein